MNFLKKLLYFFAGLYVLACIVLFFAQESLIFHPRAVAADRSYGAGTEVDLTAEDGTVLNAVFVDQVNEPGAVLFLHGNVGDNGRALYQARDARAAGYDLLVLDYRGFGKSGGEIVSEEQMQSDAQLAYDYLAERYPEDRISVVGYSLGTGMASHLAANNDPGQLVLIAPYLSITAMKNLWFWLVPDFILKYDLDNAEHLAEVRCPTTIVHGTADRLIPFNMAERLRDVAPERIELVELPGVGHRGAVTSGALGRILAQP